VEGPTAGVGQLTTCVRKTPAIVVVASCLLTLLATPASAATTEVHIVGGVPNPREVTIDEGDMVAFVNDDNVEHRIFAGGQQRGDPIAPGTSENFGPFQTGGQKGTFAYSVDDNASGTIFVRASVPAPSSTTTTSTPATTTTTTQPATTTSTTTTTTSTTLPTTTTVASTTTATVAVQPDAKKKKSSNPLAVIGFALLVAGVGGLIVATERSRRGGRPR
jgi:plastocyanin